MTTIDELRGENLNFTHLHVHTDFSFLDGFNKAKNAAKRASELGMTAMAITDHNHLGGVLPFQKEMKKAGIKPILGVEMYWTWNSSVLGKDKDGTDGRDEWAMKQAKESGFDLDQAIHDIENPLSEKTGKPLKPHKISKTEMNRLLSPYTYDSKQYHIILLAINQKGWQNLVKLQSKAAEICTFNGRYCCDDTLLEQYNEGLIFQTACIGNAVPNLFNQGKHEQAIAQLDNWHRIFGDRMRIEIQPLNIQEQHIANFHLIQYATENNIKLVSTTDTHYTLESDWDDHDTLICIGMGKNKQDTDRMHYLNDYWIRSYDEMIEAYELQADSMAELFEDIFSKEAYMDIVRDSLANTNDIADMVEDIQLGSDVNLFPEITVPPGMTPESFLTLQCFQNLYKYKNAHPEIDLILYEKRLNDELKVINTKGFAPYILVVQDYIEWANKNGCPTGPGRGSGAGSLVLFVLGITKIIDPIKYGLLFFRFLTMDRSAPPDIDTDFEYYNRPRVIAYLQEKYGAECVANIGTFTEMGVKSGLKDVGRVLQIDYGVMQEISRKVDEWSDRPSLKFEDLDKLQESSRESERVAYAEFCEYETRYPELFRLTRAFEGTKRNYGKHASGVLITPFPVSDLFPTRVNEKEGGSITLYTGVQLEDLKAIKFDILGLTTLSVINETLKAIDESLTMEDLYAQVDIDDPDMFRMIQAKRTDGLFQIESNLFKGMVESIVPNTMNDIIVITSLGRPGPLSAGMDKAYANRKHGREEALEPLPGTWEIVKDTYGTICYQEQIMLIAKVVAGFDDNQSDSYLRKAFAKKQKDKMTMCRQWFIYGKKNINPPEGHDPDDQDQPEYDPKAKHGPAIKGGMANGYPENMLSDFWANIEGFADYLFNKSHAACYSYITVLTGWLKRYHTAAFMSALMSVQGGDPDKLSNYSKVSRELGLTVSAPDINLSEIAFSSRDNHVLYGIGSIKGVGASSIPEIMENRPYSSVEDLLNRVSKKGVNKRVITALAQAGAFDRMDTNRYRVLNNIYDIRKDKDDRYDEDTWNEEACMALETETLGTPVTYIPYWDTVPSGETLSVTMKLISLMEKADKKGNMMAFVNGEIEGCNVRCLVFSSTYCGNAGRFDVKHNEYISLKGTKDDKGAFIVSKVLTDIIPIQKKSSLLDIDLEERIQGII